MTNSRFKYAATLLGALAVLAVAPATAHALDDHPAGPGGCYYTDADGYDIPIHNGEDVFVDGKIVSCRDGKIIVTTAPMRGGDRAPVLDRGDQTAPVLDTPTQRPPVFSPNLPVLVATP